MTKSEFRVVIFIFVITIICAIVVSCGRRQPPGSDLTGQLRYVERNKVSE